MLRFINDLSELPTLVIQRAAYDGGTESYYLVFTNRAFARFHFVQDNYDDSVSLTFGEMPADENDLFTPATLAAGIVSEEEYVAFKQQRDAEWEASQLERDRRQYEKLKAQFEKEDKPC